MSPACTRTSDRGEPPGKQETGAERRSARPLSRRRLSRCRPDSGHRQRPEAEDLATPADSPGQTRTADLLRASRRGMGQHATGPRGRGPHGAGPPAGSTRHRPTRRAHTAPADFVLVTLQPTYRSDPRSAASVPAGPTPDPRPAPDPRQAPDPLPTRRLLGLAPIPERPLPTRRRRAIPRRSPQPSTSHRRLDCRQGRESLVEDRR